MTTHSRPHHTTEAQMWANLDTLIERLNRAIDQDTRGLETVTRRRNDLTHLRRTREAGEPVDLELLARLVSEEQTGPAEFSVEALIAAYWHQVSNRQRTVTTGFARLDDILSGGLEPLRLVGVLGAPNTGKTTFTHQLAESVANAGRPVLYVTSEDTPSALLAKTIARFGQVRYTAVLKGWESERQRIESGLHALTERQSYTRLRYLDAPGFITMEDIRERARAHFARYTEEQGGGPGVLVIDYLQKIARTILARSRGNGDLRMMVSEVTDQLRVISNELNCTVVAIASQNRTNYERGSHGALASAKESGDVEYTCDVIIALNEDKSDRATPPGQTAIKLYVDKNRQGRKGRTVSLNFWEDRQLFTQVED